MMPSGHKSFLVNNVKDVELLMMHNRTYAAEYVGNLLPHFPRRTQTNPSFSPHRIASAVSSRKRIDIIARAKQLGVKVTNAKAKVTTEV
jgi:large subunit ribosomal protein L32e